MKHDRGRRERRRPSHGPRDAPDAPDAPDASGTPFNDGRGMGRADDALEY